LLGLAPCGTPSADFTARGLGQLQETALASLDGGCKVVDYAQLTPAVIAAALGWAGASYQKLKAIA
jgi:hypothetical protein